ncbi:MAG: 16S rRNA (uracil(1498)-N(3))-methyltransferase [Chthoniobacteraceae bacterium]
MPRFYISPERWNPASLELGEEEAHHALHVLRMKAGERAVLFNGQGSQATAEITATTKRTVSLKALELTQAAPQRCRITLGQAIPKGKNMDLVVQKATELGAAAVAPLLTEHTVVQCDAREALRKQEKWQAVAVEACKQCGQNWLPAVLTPQPMERLLQNEFDLKLIASLAPGSRHPKEVLAEAVRERGGTPPQSVLILIGPEGDFSPRETALALDAGCKPITLGPIVLRTETAALYCLSVLSYELLG